MSFTKTVSVVAALTSIFAAGATGWKLADTQKDVPLSPLDQKVMELERKLIEVTEPQVSPVVPQPITLPAQVVTQPVTPPRLRLVMRKYPILNTPAFVSRTSALCKILRKSHMPFVIPRLLPLCMPRQWGVLPQRIGSFGRLSIALSACGRAIA